MLNALIYRKVSDLFTTVILSRKLRVSGVCVPAVISGEDLLLHLQLPFSSARLKLLGKR